jgi:hypothetical protein
MVLHPMVARTSLLRGENRPPCNGDLPLSLGGESRMVAELAMVEASPQGIMDRPQSFTLTWGNNSKK